MTAVAHKVSDRIVQFALGTNDGTIPPAALQVMRLSLADWVTVAIAGADEPVTKVTRALIEQEGGAEDACAIGLSHKVPARSAALVNGAAGHALDYDDTHFASLGHPSAAVIPAVLAVADRTSAKANQIKSACLIGMEIAVRIGVWLGRSHYRTGFHITGTAGTFGATMAAARLLGLDAAQAHQALSIAASRASGVKAQFGSMGKPMHAGFAAANGVEAAQLAQLGFVAGEYALEASQGFARTHHGEFDAQAFDGLGESYLFEQVSHKFHACCHGTHATAEALISIRDQYQVKPDAIKSIAVTVHPQYLDICNIETPSTGLQAKFSYHMVAALTMRQYDTARMDTFDDGICADAELKKVRDCVRVLTDSGLSETSAEVTVRMSGGASYSETHDLLAPVDLASRERRVRAKCASILGVNQADELWQKVAMGSTTPSQWISEYLS